MRRRLQIGPCTDVTIAFIAMCSRFRSCPKEDGETEGVDDVAALAVEAVIATPFEAPELAHSAAAMSIICSMTMATSAAACSGDP